MKYEIGSMDGERKIVKLIAETPAEYETLFNMHADLTNLTRNYDYHLRNLGGDGRELSIVFEVIPHKPAFEK